MIYTQSVGGAIVTFDAAKWLSFIALLSACGGEAATPCTVGVEFETTYCSTAKVLLGREANDLVPEPAQLSERYTKMKRVWLSGDPYLKLAMVWPDTRASFRYFALDARDAGVAAAFAAGRIDTGIADLDDLLAELPIATIEPTDNSGTRFTLVFSQVVGSSELLRRIASMTVIAPQAEMDPDSGYDTVFSLQADGSEVADVSIGGPDCEAGCVFSHAWRVELSLDGTSRVTDLGGDPVPDEARAYAMELPDP